MTTYESSTEFIKTKLRTSSVDKQSGDRSLRISNTDGRGFTTWLSARSQRELAFELLEPLFDIEYPFGEDGQIQLIPKRPPVKVGQFYRVISNAQMSGQFAENPLVKVVSVYDDGDFYVQTKRGSGSSWPKDGMDLLTGPLDVAEVVVETNWVETSRLGPDSIVLPTAEDPDASDNPFD